MKEGKTRRIEHLGLAGLLSLALSCSSLAPGGSAAMLSLSLGQGDTIAYTAELACSTEVWPPESATVHRAQLAYRVVEASELGYTLSASLKTDSAQVSWNCEVTGAGKVLDQEVAQGMELCWRDAVDAGLIKPCVFLPGGPVHPGQSWKASAFGGEITYVYRGTGFLLGRFGELVDFSGSSQWERDGVYINNTVSGTAVLCPGSGLVVGLRGRARILEYWEGQSLQRSIRVSVISR